MEPNSSPIKAPPWSIPSDNSRALCLARNHATLRASPHPPILQFANFSYSNTLRPESLWQPTCYASGDKQIIVVCDTALRRQPLARQTRLPRVVFQAATSGRANLPPADRRDPLKIPVRPPPPWPTRAPSSAIQWTLSHGDQRCPMSGSSQIPWKKLKQQRNQRLPPASRFIGLRAGIRYHIDFY